MTIDSDSVAASDVVDVVPRIGSPPIRCDGEASS
jgi:hypothetical protein